MKDEKNLPPITVEKVVKKDPSEGFLIGIIITLIIVLFAWMLPKFFVGMMGAYFGICFVDLIMKGNSR